MISARALLPAFTALARGGRQHEALAVRKTPLLNDLSSDNSVDGNLMDGHSFRRSVRLLRTRLAGFRLMETE